jgi:hypothetical protein
MVVSKRAELRGNRAVRELDRRGMIKIGGKEPVAKKINKKQAYIISESCDDNKCRLRMTPPGQKTVKDLVKEGDFIKITGRGLPPSGGKVVSVTAAKVYGLPVFSISFVRKDAVPLKKGDYRDSDLRGVNECVAQDNKILKLFENNMERVTVIKKGVKTL